jgi:hypothetical protein
MKPDFFRFQSQNIPTENPKPSVSTLLIPAELFDLLIQKYGRRNFKATFHSLLSQYRNLLSLGVLPKSHKLKTLYQADNLNLIPLKFRPDPSDWMELGILSSAIGVSRCLLFSFILELDFSLLEEFLSIPAVRDVVTTPSIFLYEKVWQLSGDRSNFTRKYHLKT